MTLLILSEEPGSPRELKRLEGSASDRVRPPPVAARTYALAPPYKALSEPWPSKLLEQF
jgi:hypothetical protein